MNRTGFTLIELLVAIVVLVIVTGIVFVAFVSVTDTAAVARENTQRVHLQQFLLRHLSVNLNALYTDPGCIEPSYAFISKDADGMFGPADTLSLTVALPMEGPRALPGVFKRVTYEVTEPSFEGPLLADAGVSTDPGEDAPEIARVLRITEEPFILAEYSEIQESPDAITFNEFDGFQQMAQVRQVPVASFDLSFYDGNQWTEQWDSLQAGMLPWAVRVRANFPRSDEERSADIAAGIDFQEEADLDLVVTFPVGAGTVSPWIDRNHARRLDGIVEMGPGGQPVAGGEEGAPGGTPGNPGTSGTGGAAPRGGNR
jgi:prepilin-type N-terminal cleavage/methylation domain-containing protein